MANRVITEPRRSGSAGDWRLRYGRAAAKIGIWFLVRFIWEYLHNE